MPISVSLTFLGFMPVDKPDLYPQKSQRSTSGRFMLTPLAGESELLQGRHVSHQSNRGQEANATLWGVQWIRDHAASQKVANKVRQIGFDE
jgi:hypothetical protein